MINPFASSFMIATRTDGSAPPRPAPTPSPKKARAKRPVFTVAAALRG